MKGIKRPKALKNNDRIGIFYKSITYRPTDQQTNGPTDGWTHALIEMRGRIEKFVKKFAPKISQLICLPPNMAQEWRKSGAIVAQIGKNKRF